jgi:hypothetical protein
MKPVRFDLKARVNVHYREPSAGRDRALSGSTPGWLMIRLGRNPPRPAGTSTGRAFLVRVKQHKIREWSGIRCSRAIVCWNRGLPQRMATARRPIRSILRSAR